MSIFFKDNGNQKSHCFISNSLEELMSVTDVLILISPAG